MNSVHRLITYFAPENYNLTLTIDRAKRSFEGAVVIAGETRGDHSTVAVHAKDLTLSSISVNDIETTWKQEENDEIHIEKGSATGRLLVKINFTGVITDTMNGMYPCYYEHDGIKKELIATQFESHYAREVFPCIDEPEAKATFDVTLITEDNVTVLGNMPVISQESHDNLLTTTFDTSPKMSTYLLAWVVGEFHKKTATTASGVEVNVWATPAQRPESLDFGLDIATRTIDFFEDYFQTPYPLPKSDHVALPDFSSGAMENWGLITYRETALLADPAVTAATDRHYAATVIAHELSHQWFGNLVTMKWWNDLWLNESFASIMENVAVDALEPSWDIWLMEATSGIPSALGRDAIHGVQAVQSDVNHPDEIQTLFDPSIVYAKGSRLLLMLQTYIGENAMKKGLQSYFKEFSYSNTEADDLWKHLSAASGEDISSFMHSWLTKPGYPVVHMHRTGTTVTLTQEQFFIGEHAESKELWPLPLNTSIQDAPQIFDTASLEMESSEKVLLLNKGATGHFITHYDTASLQSILESIDTLDVIDRLYLLQEQSLLAKAGIISTADLLPLLVAYKNETDSNVWDVLAGIIADVRRFIEPATEEDEILRTIVSRLTDAEYRRLGWDIRDNEPESDTKQRATIISLKLYSEDPLIVTEALRRYKETPLEELDPELRSTIIAQAVKHPSSETIIEDLLSVYTTHQHSGVRDDISIGLTATKDESAIKKLAEIAKDTSVVRLQDFTYWFVRLLRNRYGRDYMWQWTQDNWKWIEETFRGDSHYDILPRYVASSLTKRAHLTQFIAFFEPLKNDLALKRNIEIGITELEGRVTLLERDQELVVRALREFTKDDL